MDLIQHPQLITETLMENQNKVDRSDIQIKTLEKEIQKLDAQQARLLGLYLENALDKALLKQKANEIKQAQLGLQEEVDRIKSQKKAKLSAKDIMEIEEYCQQIASKHDLLTIADKRQILKLLQIEVTCDRTTQPFTVELRGIIHSEPSV